MTVEAERVGRLEERMGRAESDITDLRRTTVSTAVFEARMQTVDLKLDGLTDVLKEVSEDLKSRSNLRGGLLFPLSVALPSGLVVALVTYFLNH